MTRQNNLETTTREAGCTAREAMDVASVRPTQADMLDYMADMLIEFKAIAEKSSLTTLSGLLALAHSEAVLRRNDLTTRREAR